MFTVAKGRFQLISEHQCCQFAITVIKMSHECAVLVVGTESGMLLFYNSVSLQLLHSMCVSPQVPSDLEASQHFIDFSVIASHNKRCRVSVIDLGSSSLKDDFLNVFAKIQTAGDDIIHYGCHIDNLEYPSSVEVETLCTSAIADVSWNQPSCFYTWATIGMFFE